MYSVGRTARCLKSHGFEVLEGPQCQTLSVRRGKSEVYELLFHPSVDDAKALDITRWNSNFGGFDFHRVRHGNVSVIWATGGVVPRRPSSTDFAAVNGCLRVAPTNYGQSSLAPLRSRRAEVRHLGARLGPGPGARVAR